MIVTINEGVVKTEDGTVRATYLDSVDLEYTEYLFGGTTKKTVSVRLTDEEETALMRVVTRIKERSEHLLKT